MFKINKFFMKTTLYGLLVLVVLMGALISCESDAPTAANVNLEMKATTSLSKINGSGRGMATGLVFHDVLLGVTELEFETQEEDQSEEDHDSEDGEDHDGEDENEDIEFEGHFVVDLIHGTSTPDFGVADLLPGLYKEIEIALGPVLEHGNSIFIAFELPREGEETVKIEYSSSAEFEIEIEREAGFQLEGGHLNQVLVLLDLDALFSGIDFNHAVIDADGVIRINESSNANLAALIETHLGNVLEAGEDDDDDGEIDED